MKLSWHMLCSHPTLLIPLPCIEIIRIRATLGASVEGLIFSYRGLRTGKQSLVRGGGQPLLGCPPVSSLLSREVDNEGGSCVGAIRQLHLTRRGHVWRQLESVPFRTSSSSSKEGSKVVGRKQNPCSPTCTSQNASATSNKGICKEQQGDCA